MTKERIQETPGRFGPPEWRLYANFLHREIARLWYGKKSVFKLVKGDAENREFWELFNLIFAMTTLRFGATHGLTKDELDSHVKFADIQYNKLRSRGFPYNTYAAEIYFGVRWILGDELASEFLYDPQIGEIVCLALSTIGLAAEGKMPPYTEFARLHPIEFYEWPTVAPELEEQFYGKLN